MSSIRVAVIGLGYVGLPLSATLAEAGFDVIGIDTDRQKAVVEYNDEYVPSLQLPECTLASQPLTEKRLQTADCVALITNHTYFDISWLAR